MGWLVKLERAVRSYFSGLRIPLMEGVEFSPRAFAPLFKAVLRRLEFLHLSTEHTNLNAMALIDRTSQISNPKFGLRILRRHDR